MKNGIKRLLLQAGCCLAAALTAFVLKPLPVLHGILVWGLLPITALISAFITVRRGVNPYISWILPPVTFSLVEYFGSAGALPSWSGGCMVLIAFCAVVGSAAADVCGKQEKKK